MSLDQNGGHRTGYVRSAKSAKGYGKFLQPGILLASASLEGLLFRNGSHHGSGNMVVDAAAVVPENKQDIH